MVTLIDKTRKLNLKLSAVDCKYVETNKVLYFGSWLSIFVQAISIYFKATTILRFYYLLKTNKKGNFMIWKAQSDDYYILSRENFNESNSKDWIRFQKGNLIEYSFVSSSADSVTLFDRETSKSFKLNSNSMVDQSSKNTVYGYII